ncbi:type 1 glutamine amidotransferase domain-containing protein [Cohnella sp.]|uniref:type 1 glutamine amidotransferase domain-containing protein n=1 Tax=Cohnella sp. TaxID=1883426 RepID=UPI003567D8BE
MIEQNILIVVTNGHVMDNGKLAGIWLSEFAEPYEEFTREGFEITVASPKGGASQIDPSSIEDDVPEKWKVYKELLLRTTPLSNVTAKDFAGIFLPGGHGAMFDLPNNLHLHNLLTDFSKSNKPIGAVCHGPAGLVGAQLDTGNPLIEGKRVTGFTNEEEKETQLDSLMPFLLETKMKELQSEFIAHPNWRDHVEVDGNLVTGQNPQSSKSVAIAFLNLL